MRHFVLLILASLPLLAADHPLGGPLAASYLRGVSDQLVNPDPQKRAPAIVRLRADGSTAFMDFGNALNRAESAALGNLRRNLQLIRPTDAGIETLKKELGEYKTLSAAARVLVQTDHHKDKQKFAEMDRAFAAAEKSYERLMRTLKPGGTAPVAQLIDALQWVAEIRRDQEWCAEKDADLATLPMSKVLEIEGAPNEIKSLVAELEPILARREFLRVVMAAHASMKWARPDQVQYANLLDGRRVIIGLRPYLLAEKLSAAAAGHSDEMVRLKYFSHTSPVRENKGFGERVKNARFEGSAGGECIYAGGSSASGAHGGWWYSDGHRLILYSSGGNAQGVGRAGGGTWTFLNGSFSKFPM